MASDSVPLLDAWRQGDLSFDPVELPALVLDGAEPAFAYVNAPHGVAVISQSCDIVRDPEHRPWIHVAILEEQPPERMDAIKLGNYPHLLYIEPIAGRNLAANLDDIAIVDKKLAASWTRIEGCASDTEQRRVAAALARHRHRFAFPDAFNELVKPLRRWIEDKRSKNSEAGNFVRAIREVRVMTDKWEAPSDLLFLVLVDDFPDPLPKEWTASLETLAEKGKRDGFPDPEFRLVSYDMISAREYLASDRLDWEGLSES